MEKKQWIKRVIQKNNLIITHGHVNIDWWKETAFVGRRLVALA